MRRLLVALLAFAITISVRGQCAGERRPVRIATDADASAIQSVPLPTTIAFLHTLPMTRPLPQDRRVKPQETTLYSVTATLTEYRVDEDGDAYLVLADRTGRTIVAEIPPIACTSSSRFALEIRAARQTFDARFAAKSTFQRAMIPVEVRGVAYFDFLRDQRGLAPNGLGLHPVTSINFSPFVAPVPPKFSRRRAVAPPHAPCPIPSLTLTANKVSACAGEFVRLQWQSSDPVARVAIDAVGIALPANGEATVSPNASSVYSGRASNPCGVGPEAVAVVNVRPGASASLSGPSVVQRAASVSLFCVLSSVSSWSLTSSLRNSIAPSSGTQSGSIMSTYTATNSGSDTVTLSANGDCGTITKTLSILVTQPPPPPNLGLLCCDGTRSPTCFSCANKQGCCSGHKGVCGC